MFILQMSSYFNKSDLKLAGARLRHLNEESGLVAVVFNDVVVHVDVYSAERHKHTPKKGYFNDSVSFSKEIKRYSYQFRQSN